MLGTSDPIVDDVTEKIKEPVQCEPEFVKNDLQSMLILEEVANLDNIVSLADFFYSLDEALDDYFKRNEESILDTLLQEDTNINTAVIDIVGLIPLEF